MKDREKFKISRKFKREMRLNTSGGLASTPELKPETSIPPRQKTRIFLNKSINTSLSYTPNKFSSKSVVDLHNNADSVQKDDFDHRIFSAFEKSIQLPCININFQQISQNALIDTGSSLSFIDKDFFHLLKQQVPYKFLSRKVSIKTINSIVKFSGCIQINIRVQGNHFSHNLYITEINNNKFTVILGFDFLSKFSITIAPSFNAILYKDKKIPFVNDNEKIIS